MWIKKIVYLVIDAFCLFSFGGTAAASGMGQTVRIGIREGRGSVALTSDSGLGVWKTILVETSARTPLQIALKGNAVTVGECDHRWCRRSTASFVGRFGEDYRRLRLPRCYKSHEIAPAMRPDVVNVVPVEEYLYGVVGKEMSPSWHREALKAQAVAARTYAISHKNYFASRGFDMTDDTSSQIYAGINGESPSVIAAVDATRGEILTYGGKPIDAFFCSTAGGWTENSENVWGSRIPYLRGVSDDSSRMPSYRWSVTTTPEKLAANLTAGGKGVGKVRSITLSPLGKRPMAVSDRGVSGRVLSMTVNGSAGSVRVTGNAFQSIYGLKSTLFDFSQGGAVPDPDSGRKGRSATMTVKAGVPITIYGYGWGHGLGMSQYGAYQMAQEHGSADTYYRTILTHYYTGTRLEKLY